MNLPVETGITLEKGMPTLFVVRGAESGLQFELAAGRTCLGSGAMSDITLEGLAPLHAEVYGEEDRFLLICRAAEADCVHNGRGVEQVELAEGDRIRLGPVEFIFRWEAPPGDGLIAASSLFYLFRAMHGLWLEDQRVLEAQIRDIVRVQLPGVHLDMLVGGGTKAWKTELATRYPEAGSAWAERVDAALAGGNSRWVDGVLHTFDYAPGQSVCLIGQGENRTAWEQSFAALAALASAALETAAEIQSLEVRAEAAEQQWRPETGLRGTSERIEQLNQQIAKVAPRDTTVLIQGESGTGKELVARALHSFSKRAKRPFVALNCAAITDTLLESELFGHEKGAFTGATEARAGKLELAAGGTVFLDEIGEMAMALQAKLLRVLQQRECERVGGRRVIPLDIRVVAATNRDLAVEVKQGRFREDLFHRLNVITLQTPPLRNRPEDILPLALHFLRLASERAGRKVVGISAGAARAMAHYHWPGNVRELENVMERAVVLGDSSEVQLEDLPETLLETSPAHMGELPSFHQGLVDAKRSAILEAWRSNDGDYKLAAAQLGIHPNSLLRMIRTLGLRGQLNP